MSYYFIVIGNGLSHKTLLGPWGTLEDAKNYSYRKINPKDNPKILYGRITTDDIKRPHKPAATVKHRYTPRGKVIRL